MHELADAEGDPVLDMTKWWQPVAGEVLEIGDGPARRVPLPLAVAITSGVVIWGNAVVIAQRRVGGDAGEIVTTIAHPVLGATACAALLATGWRGADLGLVPPSRAALAGWQRPAILLALGVGGVAIATAVRGGPYEGGSARLSVLRVVVGTALGEELLHRAVLFPLWAATRRSPRFVAVAHGIAFGAWHIAAVAPKGWGGRIVGILGPAIPGTALFLWARCRSRSVAGSWLLHSSTNLPGVAAAAWSAKGR